MYFSNPAGHHPISAQRLLTSALTYAPPPPPPEKSASPGNYTTLPVIRTRTQHATRKHVTEAIFSRRRLGLKPGRETGVMASVVVSLNPGPSCHSGPRPPQPQKEAKRSRTPPGEPRGASLMLLRVRSAAHGTQLGHRSTSQRTVWRLFGPVLGHLWLFLSQMWAKGPKRKNGRIPGSMA